MSNELSTKLGMLLHANIGERHEDKMRLTLRIINQLLGKVVKSVVIVDPPSTPNGEDAYWIPKGSTPTGLWAAINVASSGKYVFWSSGRRADGTDTLQAKWEYLTPEEGWPIHNLADGVTYRVVGGNLVVDSVTPIISPNLRDHTLTSPPNFGSDNPQGQCFIVANSGNGFGVNGAHGDWSAVPAGHIVVYSITGSPFIDLGPVKVGDKFLANLAPWWAISQNGSYVSAGIGTWNGSGLDWVAPVDNERAVITRIYEGGRSSDGSVYQYTSDGGGWFLASANMERLAGNDSLGSGLTYANTGALEHLAVYVDNVYLKINGPVSLASFVKNKISKTESSYQVRALNLITYSHTNDSGITAYDQFDSYIVADAGGGFGDSGWSSYAANTLLTYSDATGYINHGVIIAGDRFLISGTATLANGGGLIDNFGKNYIIEFTGTDFIEVDRPSLNRLITAVCIDNPDGSRDYNRELRWSANDATYIPDLVTNYDMDTSYARADYPIAGAFLLSVDESDPSALTGLVPGHVAVVADAGGGFGAGAWSAIEANSPLMYTPDGNWIPFITSDWILPVRLLISDDATGSLASDVFKIAEWDSISGQVLQGSMNIMDIDYMAFVNQSFNGPFSSIGRAFVILNSASPDNGSRYQFEYDTVKGSSLTSIIKIGSADYAAAYAIESFVSGLIISTNGKFRHLKINADGLCLLVDPITNELTIAHIVRYKIPSQSESTAATFDLDSWSKTYYRSADYVVQVSQGSVYERKTLSVISDGTTPNVVEASASAVGGVSTITFAAVIVGGNVVLQWTNSAATITGIKAIRTNLIET